MTEAVNGGSNISALKTDIVNGIAKINQHKAARSAANGEITAVREDMKAKGIPKKALTMAMAYMDLDPEAREGFDVAYDICREAVGLPYNAQGDLFVAPAKQAKEMMDDLGDKDEDDDAGEMSEEEIQNTAEEMDEQLS